MSELHHLGIEELGRRLRAREVSSVEATETMLDRIDALDDDLTSYAVVLADEARSAAGVADDEIAQGHDRGPLHGVPVAVKDLCDVEGVATGAGTAVLRDNIAKHDSTVVRRLRQAGAVIVGKLNMTEGAMAGYNPACDVPVNPWNTERWAGVSSSGSGVATAAGLCFGSLGSDTGGSIRFPAAANGVVGLKPTYGRVSRHGVFPLAETFDHVGPLTRSSADAAIMLQAIAGPDPADPTSIPEPVGDLLDGIDDGVAGVRIGLDEPWCTDGVASSTAAALRAALAVLVDAGAQVVPVEMPAIDRELWLMMVATEAAHAHADHFPDRADEYGSFMAGVLAHGNQVTGTQYAAGAIERRRFTGELQRVFDDVDVIASPVMAHAAFPAPRDGLRGSIEDIAAMAPDLSIKFTACHDFSGSPTITLPGGFDEDGLPIGVQFAGRHLDEAGLCRLGRTFERATDWHTRHPLP